MSAFPVFNYETVPTTKCSLESLPLLSMCAESLQHPQYILKVHQSTIAVLEANFDPKRDLIILVVSGLAGIGKSTWLNTIALSLDPELRSDPFPVGEEQFSITRGLMVYPKPLKLFQDSNSPQVMLCDMEGFDGLRKDVSNEVNRHLLKRTVFCGLMLSSRFCVHSNVRLQPSQIESLNDIYGMVKELQTMFRLEKPQIALVIANTNSIAKEHELKTQIRTQCSLSEDLYSSLKVFPRGQLPEKFQSSRRTRDLLGSLYHENALRFILSSLAYPKSRHGFNTRFHMSDFTALITNLQEAVNKDNFMLHYISSIKISLEQLIRPKMAQHQEAFEKNVQTILQQRLADAEALKVSLRQAKNATWETLIREIEGEFHVEVGSIPEIMKVLKDFEESLENRVVMLLLPQKEGEKVSPPRLYPPAEIPLQPKQRMAFTQNSPSLEERLAKCDLPQGKQAALFGHIASFPGPLKKDGTPDMRFKKNREMAGLITCTCTNSEIAPSFPKGRAAAPLKKSGSSELQFSVNQMHVKKDGTPDMRYAANRNGK